MIGVFLCILIIMTDLPMDQPGLKTACERRRPSASDILGFSHRPRGLRALGLRV